MDYLLDKYLFEHLPFAVTDSTKKAITSKAVDLVQIADWACKAQDVRKLAANQPSFLAAEAIYFFLFVSTFVHAFRHGRRYLFTWLGITFVGMTTECLRFINPAWDIIWHAQGTFTYLGMRIPCYLFGVYQFVFYVSYVFARRLYLYWWAEGPAAGLISVLLLFPIFPFGAKLLWFQWHDSDIAVTDKFLWVPWTALLFIASTSCSFLWYLHLLRQLILPENYNWKLFMREFFCAGAAGILSVFSAVGQAEILVTFIRGAWNINMGITTSTVLGVFTLLFFINDRHNGRKEARSQVDMQYWFDDLFCAVSINYLFFMLLPFVTDPGTIVSEGLHQPIGPCNITEQYNTVVGTIVQRKKYYCPYSQTANCYDFHCLPNRVPPIPEAVEALEWYPICGKDYENRWEYLALIWSFSLLSFAVLYQLGSRSGPTPLDVLYKKHGNIHLKYTANKALINCAEEKESEDFALTSSQKRGSGDAKKADVTLNDFKSDEKELWNQTKSLIDFVKSNVSEKLHKTPITARSRSASRSRSSSASRVTNIKNSFNVKSSESLHALRARRKNL